MLPKIFYAGNEHWAEHPFVIPEYAFSVQVSGNPRLSSEHTGFHWCDFQEASELLEYDSNKIALWELDERLKKWNLSGRLVRMTEAVHSHVLEVTGNTILNQAREPARLLFKLINDIDKLNDKIKMIHL